MRDTELYGTILGLTQPGAVRRVQLDVKGQRVVITVVTKPGPFRCPECQQAGPGYDRRPRRWRHLDTCQFTTWSEAEVPRVACPTHGVRQLAPPGPSRTATSRPASSGWPSTCAGRAQ